jgi:hypothetical protein
VVGHQRVDGAVGQRGAQRIAVALLAQRRRSGGRGCQSKPMSTSVRCSELMLTSAVTLQALGLGRRTSRRRLRC